VSSPRKRGSREPRVCNKDSGIPAFAGMTIIFMSTQNIQEKIQQELELIRPHLQMDGGDVELVEFNEQKGVLKLRLQGACVGCPMSAMTLQEGIGRAIKEKIPEVKEVMAV